jgi:hypothetical protein
MIADNTKWLSVFINALRGAPYDCHFRVGIEKTRELTEVKGWPHIVRIQ